MIWFWLISACAWKCSCCQKIQSKKTPSMTAPVNLSLIFFIYFLFIFVFLPLLSWTILTSRTEIPWHVTLPHTHTLSSCLLCVVSTSHHLFYPLLNLFLWQRRWEKTSLLLLLDAPRCQSHPTLRTFLEGFFFQSLAGEFAKSALRKLSRWPSVSVKRISYVHVRTLLLFVCFVQTCAPAQQRKVQKKHTQFQHPHAETQTRFGVDYITPQVCFANGCHRLMVSFVHGSAGQTKPDQKCAWVFQSSASEGQWLISSVLMECVWRWLFLHLVMIAVSCLQGWIFLTHSNMKLWRWVLRLFFFYLFIYFSCFCNIELNNELNLFIGEISENMRRMWSFIFNDRKMSSSTHVFHPWLKNISSI